MTKLILRGGLGNQLFQFAAGISMAREDELELWTETGEPRKTAGRVDLDFFQIPAKIHFCPGPKDRFSKKLLSLNLRIGLNAELTRKNRLLKLSFKYIANLFFSIKAHKFQSLITANGVGYSPLVLKSREAILNGYFQAEQWVNEPRVTKILRTIQLKNPTESFQKWVKEIELEKPIAVHIRLGDYKLEDKIGILNPNYFHKSLIEIKSATNSRKVWIFSDEPQSIDIAKYVPSEFNARVFSDMSLNPAETLELMRHAAGYVISNSTFSWWAAYLSYNSDCCRIMPKPWFKGQESPLGIRPNDWKEIEEPF